LTAYLEVSEARNLPGMRLALTAGVPGPWSESAKAIFRVKGIDYVRVRQEGGMENAALREWTGRSNAPVAVWNDEPPVDGWADILGLAERVAPAAPLIPGDFDERNTMFGLCHEICGPAGYGWQRRLMLLTGIMESDLPDTVRAPAVRLADRYGYSKAAAEAAKLDVCETLTRLSQRLLAQRDAGSRYFIGASLTALDLYWACFAALHQPLAPDVCPMPEGLRRSYTVVDPDVLKACDPILLEHRDFIYATHLELPLDF
jgi:glutathione S-transferase